MFAKVAVHAACVVVLSASFALAQPSTFQDPAELPPASFTGEQYIDSKGCVFLRAGFGGRTTWVPRITRDRKQMCGQATAEAAAAPVVTPNVTERSDGDDVAEAELVQDADPAPLRRKKVRRDTALASGHTAPQMVANGQIVPKGYIPAWKDDRLNLNRAKGSAAGQAAQDRVWTREVPANTLPGAEILAPVTRAAATVRSTGSLYVQVGTFGQSANADRAEGRLGGLGLPVARSRTRLNGQSVTVVLAGPFGSSGEAQAALSAARRAGFPDAFVVR